MLVPRILTLALTLLATATRPAMAQTPDGEAPDERLSIPGDIDVDVARLHIRHLFKNEYRDSSPKAQRALARTLLVHADEEAAESATRFVLLQEARRISATAGDAMIALAAWRTLAETYRVDRLKLKEETLEAISRRPSGEDSALIATEAWFDLIDEHLEKGHAGSANRAATRALQTAAKAGTTSVSQLARYRRKRVAEIEKKAEKIESALKAARAGVATPEDLLRAGEFHCFSLGNWKTGLPFLSRGPDTDLAKAARADMENPVTTSEQQGVAENWERIAKKRASARREIMGRARHWYWKASLDLRGIAGLRLGKKLEELDKFAAVDGTVGLVDTRVRVWESRRWQAHPPNRMTISEDERGMKVKNTTTEHWQAHFVCARVLDKDFVVYLEIRGGRTVGLVSADGQDKVLSISGTPDWQTVIIRRKRGKVQFSSNGEPLDYSVAHEANPKMNALVVVSINADRSCSIRKLRILSEG